MAMIRKRLLFSLIGFILAMVLVASAGAAPGLINYQGKLLRNGEPVTTDAPIIMTFKIFIEEFDTGGSPVWMESQNVDVVGGVYSVKLGAVNPLASSLFNESNRDCWLEVTVDGEILSPRQHLTSVPFALNAETLDGYTAIDLDQSIHVDRIDNPHQVTAAQVGAATPADITWSNLAGIPAELTDGDDVGITAETDPTVLASVKDGISWSEVTGIPAGFADGIDNNSEGDITGVTAGTGLIGGGSSGDVTLEVKSPLNLSGDLTVANNLGIGLLNPNKKLYVMDDIAGLAFSLKIENHAAGDEPGESDVGILFSTGGSGSGDRGKGALVYETTGTWNRGSFHFLQESGANANNPDMADSVLTVTNSGRVGVGTGNPSEKLEIKGNLKLSHPDSGIIFNDGSKQVTAFPGSGPGSSLDADTLDGLHAADIVSMSGGSLPSGSDIPLGLLVIEGLTLSDPTGYILDGTTVSRSVDVVKYLEGDGIFHKRPGNVKVGDISISHIVAVNAGASALANWFQQVKNGTFVRRFLSMVNYRPDTTNEFLRINFFSTFPAAISYRPVSASTVEETVVLAVEEFEILTDSTAEINGNWRAEVESLGNMYVRDIKNVGGGVEIIEYLDGDDPRTKKRPGHYKANDLEFVDLGAGSARKFLNWHFSVTQNCEKKSIGNWYGDVLMFNAYECWPSSFSGISLDAQGEFVINKAIMSGEMVERPQ